MRTYGRISDELGNKTWIEVTTDANGYNDDVWITTVIQTLKLNLGESPFWANYGIPAHPSVVQQVFPDFWVAQVQQQYAQYFASFVLAKLPLATPTYLINIVTQQGAKLVAQIAT